MNKPDFAAMRLSAEEWPLIRAAYAETYPVRPLLNHVDELRADNERLRVALGKIRAGRINDDGSVREDSDRIRQLRTIAMEALDRPPETVDPNA